jgi:hypothetical protein
MKKFGFLVSIWNILQSIGEARAAHQLYTILSSKTDDELNRMGYTRDDIVRISIDRVRGRK